MSTTTLTRPVSTGTTDTSRTSSTTRTYGTTRARQESDEIAEVIELSYSPNYKERAEAVRALCPCKLKSDYPQVWDRLIEMASDEHVQVRKNVFHVLADGSPRYREQQIVEVMQGMRNDPDLKLRRHVRRLLAHYNAGGRLNIL
jgi:HEAT repeat protein